MSMGSGEESIISSSCFCRPSATAWMAEVHSSLREAQAESRKITSGQLYSCLLINRKAISTVILLSVSGPCAADTRVYDSRC